MGLNEVTKGHERKRLKHYKLAMVQDIVGEKWRAWRDLNSRHSEPESDALSELSYRRERLHSL